jgi:hypothetical protein
MSVGEGALISGLSYIAVGRETTLGTYNTCTALLPALSCALAHKKDDKILEQIERSRTYSQHTQQMVKVDGDLNFYFQPQLEACAWLLQNAFVGTVTSATATGETAGGLAYTHTFNIGDTYQSFGSLCLNVRKGPSTGGKVFQYNGLRVGEIMFQAELNEALKCNVGLVGFNATAGSDVHTTTMQTATSALSFVDGRFSVETSYASLTSTSFWHVQSVEFGWNNNLKSDAAAGRIGSEAIGVLPPGMATFTLRAKIRFDTTTAWDAMKAATKLAAQFEFQGPTCTTSIIRQGLKVDFPVVYVHMAGEPTMGGPNEMLTSDVEFHVLRQDDTTAGFAVKGYLTNNKSSYA